MKTEEYNYEQEYEYDEIEWGNNEYNRRMTAECENILREAVENYWLGDEQGHDKLFKEVFSEKVDFKDFIINFVDEAFQEIIENNELEAYSIEFITNDFSTAESDIIYKVKEKPIYFVVEHQSTIDATMPYRMLVYVTELIKKDMKQREKIKGDYPLIIPIVINTSNRRWNVSRRYSDKTIHCEEIPAMLDLAYYVVDIHNYSMTELFKQKTMIAYAMMIEKARNREELLEILKEITQKIDKKYIDKMERILKFLLKSVISEEEMEKMIEELKERERKPMPNVIERIIEQEKKDARKIGLKEGTEKGIKRGIKEGKIIKNMANKNIPIGTIAELTETLEEEIEKILKHSDTRQNLGAN